MFCVQLILFTGLFILFYFYFWGGLFILIDYVQLQKCHCDLCFDSIKSILCPHYFAWNCLTLNSYLNSDKLIFHNNLSFFHISHILVHTVPVLQFYGYPKVLGVSPTFPNSSLPDLISFLAQVQLCCPLHKIVLLLTISTYSFYCTCSDLQGTNSTNFLQINYAAYLII